LMNFGALSRGFGTCCLRFKNDVATIPARLTSGWLGVDPLDRCKRFQVIHPPSLDLAWRKGSFILNLPLRSHHSISKGISLYPYFNKYRKVVSPVKDYFNFN